MIITTKKKLSTKRKLRLIQKEREQLWDNRIYKNLEPQSPTDQTSKSIDRLSRSTRKQNYTIQESDTKNSKFDKQIRTLAPINQNSSYSNAYIVQKYIKMHEDQMNMLTQEKTRNIRLEDKIQEVHQLWEKHKVPQQHQVTLLKLIEPLSTDKQFSQIEEEIALLEKNQAPIQRCVNAIAAREKCLKIFYTHIDTYPSIVKYDQQTRQAQADFLRRASELMLHQRLLSLNVVEGIQRWRQYFNQKFQLQNKETPFLIYYLNDGTDYIGKLVNDYQALRSTILINFYDFPVTSDPFLIFLLQDHHLQIHGSENKKVLNEMVCRIRKCELEILTTQVHSSQVRSQVNQENERVDDGSIKIISQITIDQPYLQEEQQTQQVNQNAEEAQHQRTLEEKNDQQEKDPKIDALIQEMHIQFKEMLIEGLDQWSLEEEHTKVIQQDDTILIVQVHDTKALVIYIGSKDKDQTHFPILNNFLETMKIKELKINMKNSKQFMSNSYNYKEDSEHTWFYVENDEQSNPRQHHGSELSDHPKEHESK